MVVRKTTSTYDGSPDLHFKYRDYMYLYPAGMKLMVWFRL